MKPFPVRALRAWNDGSWKPEACAFGSSPAGNTNTIQSTTPWAGQQPYLSAIYQQAGANNANDVPQYYPGDTYAGLNSTQTGLMNNIINYGSGGGNTGLISANSNLTSALSPEYTGLSEGEYNAAAPSIAGLGSGEATGLTSPAFGTAQGTIGNLASGSVANATNPAFQQSQGYLSTMLSGAELDPFTSPGFQNVVNGTLANVIPAVSASFINGGRADSGLATAAETSAATNAIGQLANQNYVQEQGLQQQAANQAASNEALGLNTTLGATGQAAANQATGYNTTLGAAGLASNNLLTQQGNQLKGDLTAPMVDQAQTGDLTTALNAAGMGQTNAQNQLNANVAAYNYGQMLPWNQLGLFESAITGTGSPGSSTETTQPYFSNTGANLLSAGLGTAGLASAAGQAGLFSASTYAPIMAALGGLFSSDRRLKTDIEEIGETTSGFPLYLFRYKNESPLARHLGVMAQDVEKVRPEAVIETPLGKMVDYIAALAP